MVPEILSIGGGPPRNERPVTYTVAACSPSATATPRPQPRLAPATNATLPFSVSDISLPRIERHSLLGSLDQGRFDGGPLCRVPAAGHQIVNGQTQWREIFDIDDHELFPLL